MVGAPSLLFPSVIATRLFGDLALRSAVLAIMGLFFAASPMSASTEMRRCSRGNASDRLVGCTDVINNTKSPRNDVVAALDGRCWALNDLERYKEALADCNSAIALNPNYSFAYNNRGVSLEHLGDLREAIKSYSIATSLNSAHKRARENYDRLSAGLGNASFSLSPQAQAQHVEAQSDAHAPVADKPTQLQSSTPLSDAARQAQLPDKPVYQAPPQSSRPAVTQGLPQSVDGTVSFFAFLLIGAIALLWLFNQPSRSQPPKPPSIPESTAGLNNFSAATNRSDSADSSMRAHATDATITVSMPTAAPIQVPETVPMKRPITPSQLEELQALAALYKDGLLNEEELTSEKRKILE